MPATLERIPALERTITVPAWATGPAIRSWNHSDGPIGQPMWPCALTYGCECVHPFYARSDEEYEAESSRAASRCCQVCGRTCGCEPCVKLRAAIERGRKMGCW